MTPSITTYDMLLRLVEQEKEAYRNQLGNVGYPLHADDKTLLFELFLDDKYTEFVMKLSYTPMDGESGRPFNRLKCSMTLDGKPISLAALKLITCTEKFNG